MDYNVIELLEQRRKQILKNIILATVILILLFLLHAFIVIHFKVAIEWIVMSILIPSALLAAYGFFVYTAGILNFERDVKNNLIKDIIDNIVENDGEVVWSGEEEISKDDFREFFSMCIDNSWHGITVNPNDQFSGSYKGIKFSTAEMFLTRRDSDGRGHKIDRGIFRGFVIEIALEGKNYSPIIFKRRFSYYPIIINRFNKIPFPKPFGSRYSTYLENKKDYPKLPSSFYNYLLSIRKNVSFGLKNDKAVIICPATLDMFKLGSIFKRVDDEKQYLKFRQEFQAMLDIIENLSRIINNETV